MSKSMFWPLAIVILGLIFMASNLGLLPPEFWNLWPLIAIVVGLGGILTSDRKEWMVNIKPKTKSASKPAKSKARRRK